MQAYLLGGRPVHFPFLSGILKYDCATCDAPCCKGNPLGIGRSRELVTLQSAQPKIPLFSTPGFSGSAMMSVSVPKEKCWFLDKKSRCRIEKRIGRNAKPAGCRLFPFQRVRSMGEAITVLPDFTCPIHVEQLPSESGPTSYDEICLDLHRAQIPPTGHGELPQPRDMVWRGALRLETQIVHESRRHLHAENYVDFAEHQTVLAASVLHLDPAVGAMAKLDTTIRTFLGAQSTHDPEIVHELVALTGILRLMTSALPRQEMPGILVALQVFLDEYENMNGSARSPGTLISIFEQRLPLLYVLSHLEKRPMLVKNADPRKLLDNFPALRAPLVSVLEKIRQNREQNVALTLQEILDAEGRAFRAPMSFDGVAMLYGLGRILLQSGWFSPI
jgi:Fe-S-cluster containining protein